MVSYSKPFTLLFFFARPTRLGNPLGSSAAVESVKSICSMRRCVLQLCITKTIITRALNAEPPSPSRISNLVNRPLMDDVPFTPELELNKELKFNTVTSSLLSCSGDESDATLPGQPRISLGNATALNTYLSEEHLTVKLDILAPKLWLVGLIDHIYKFA